MSKLQGNFIGAFALLAEGGIRPVTETINMPLLAEGGSVPTTTHAVGGSFIKTAPLFGDAPRGSLTLEWVAIAFAWYCG